MLETLLKILSWSLLSSPEIMLEDDGGLCLGWDNTIVSIHKSGSVAWSSSLSHGNDINELQKILTAGS